MKLTATTIDLDSGQVTRGAETLHLTPSERQLLAFLARHPRTPVARETLLQSVWGYDKKVRSRTLDTTMKTLRKKVEQDPRQPDHLRTVRGVGYQFVPHVAPSDTVVGRADGLQAILDALQPAHPVTLVGVAGVGKTTLSREVLRHRRGVFAPLGAARSVAEVVQAIAAALTVDSAVDEVADLAALVARQSLEVLVVDNGEQARDALADVLPALDAVALLVTSRVPLGLDVERVLPLDGLAPRDAIALLRRHAGYPDADEPVLGAIVDRLDRLPLAIELVSARARWLAPAEVLARLDDPTELLPSGPGRHGSMEAALAWSFEALSAQARTTLSACALFTGPFDVPALEATLEQATGPVVDALGELVDAGWVLRSSDGALGMLVLLRADARRRLPPSEVLRRRAARYVATVASDAVGSEALRWRATARALTDIDDADLSAALELVVAAAYASTGPTSARLAAAGRAVERAQAPTVQARALLVRAEARAASGRGDSLDDLVRAEALAEGDPELLGHILGRRGTVLFLRGALDEAEPLLEKALALHESVGDGRAQANRLANLANVALRRGRFDVAKRRFQEALALHEELGNDLSAARVMSNLGIVYLHMQRPERARRWYQQAAAAHGAIGHTPGVVRVEANLAVLDLQQGRLDEADLTFARSAERCRELGEPLLEGIAWLNRASIALERQDPIEGERHSATSRRCLEKAEAAGYLGLLDVIEALVDWLDAPCPEVLREALSRLPAANRRLDVAARGLLVDVDGPVDTLGDPMLARWMALCEAADVDGMRVLVEGEAAQDQELRMVAAVFTAQDR